MEIYVKQRVKQRVKQKERVAGELEDVGVDTDIDAEKKHVGAKVHVEGGHAVKHMEKNVGKHVEKNVVKLIIFFYFLKYRKICPLDTFLFICEIKILLVTTIQKKKTDVFKKN
jgi:hypothetical protein